MVVGAQVVDVEGCGEELRVGGAKVPFEAEHCVAGHARHGGVGGWGFPGEFAVEVEPEFAVAAFESVGVVGGADVGQACFVVFSSVGDVSGGCPRMGGHVHLGEGEGLHDVDFGVGVGAGEEAVDVVVVGGLEPDCG